MPAKLTTDQFIEKARAVHGDRYDYSQVKYVNAETKVTINCGIHGAFEQRPGSHLNKVGCPECGKLSRAAKRTLSTDLFIESAKKIHGNCYDYSRVEYSKSKEPVTIICKVHGCFSQTPDNHLRRKAGCPDCGGKKKLTTKTFIGKAKKVHGDRYDYLHVDYVDHKTPVIIVCPEHGPFPQSPTNHFAGKGCPECAGVKKLTTEKFIERARAVHGDLYDYSSVNYKNGRTNVTIICPDHGTFEKAPVTHVHSGAGCPECSGVKGNKAGVKRYTTESFIEKAKQIHGDRYDYSHVEFVNTKTPVRIICAEHGSFDQTPDSHIGRGSGCPDCSGRKQWTTEGFIDRAVAIHGDRYDYSQVRYVNRDEPVTIVCPEHGPFQSAPTNHIHRESGCPDCGGSKPHTTDSFIASARSVHGDRYDYSQVVYKNYSTPVTIICPEHGPFPQTALGHIRNESGCPGCSGNKPHTIESFVEKAQAIHGDRFDYSAVEYANNRIPVTIICPDHGPFLQAPDAHLVGRGCPECAETGFNPNVPGILYYIAIATDDGDIRYKIGITNRSVERRFRAPDLARIRIVRTWRFAVGRTAAERERKILRQYAGDRYFGAEILQTGNSELFTHDILGLDGPEAEQPRNKTRH